MNTIVMTIWILAWFVPAQVWAPVEMPAVIAPPDSSVVERANTYLQSVLAGDVPAIVAMYREDAVLMPPNQPLLQGRQAIGAFYDRMCHGPAKITTFSFNHLESAIAGDTAYDVGTYRMTLALGPGKTMDDTGKYNVILKKTGNAWEVAYLIFNSDSAAQGPSPQKH